MPATDPLVPADLLDRAMMLSPEAKHWLGVALLDSLDPTADDPADVKEAWRKEIARRIEDIRSGAVELLDADESAERIRQSLRERFAK